MFKLFSKLEVFCRKTDTMWFFAHYEPWIVNVERAKIWVRPLSMWNEMIERDGMSFKRFEFIGE